MTMCTTMITVHMIKPTSSSPVPHLLLRITTSSRYQWCSDTRQSRLRLQLPCSRDVHCTQGWEDLATVVEARLLPACLPGGPGGADTESCGGQSRSRRGTEGQSTVVSWEQGRQDLESQGASPDEYLGALGGSREPIFAPSCSSSTCNSGCVQW
ncbi:hypothetical protein M758_7G027600 [Ceratodon purpureus]|nr:hypothetical protein M758_7G027600 [Ceratodon purpureus]